MQEIEQERVRRLVMIQKAKQEKSDIIANLQRIEREALIEKEKRRIDFFQRLEEKSGEHGESSRVQLTSFSRKSIDKQKEDKNALLEKEKRKNDYLKKINEESINRARQLAKSRFEREQSRLLQEQMEEREIASSIQELVAMRAEDRRSLLVDIDRATKLQKIEIDKRAQKRSKESAVKEKHQSINLNAIIANPEVASKNVSNPLTEQCHIAKSEESIDSKQFKVLKERTTTKPAFLSENGDEILDKIAAQNAARIAKQNEAKQKEDELVLQRIATQAEKLKEAKQKEEEAAIAKKLKMDKVCSFINN